MKAYVFRYSAGKKYLRYLAQGGLCETSPPLIVRPLHEMLKRWQHVALALSFHTGRALGGVPE